MQIINVRAQHKDCGSPVSNWIAKNNAAKDKKKIDPLDQDYGYPFRNGIKWNGRTQTDKCYTIYKGGLTLD